MEVKSLADIHAVTRRAGHRRHHRSVRSQQEVIVALEIDALGE